MPDRRSAFGPFVFDGRGGLSLNGALVTLSSRGAALLQALLEADGGTVTKAALMDAAWPNTSVEESNLTVQIAALRKCLSASSGRDDWIATVPRAGYRLVRSPPVEGVTALLGGATEKPSLAVLPFTNMSSDPEQEFFADGLAEDLIADLSRVPGLLVISRNSSFTYKGKPADLRVVARDLGVRYVVEGSVRRADARIRISAQLIDTADNRHLWVDRFDRDGTDVFAVQDEIVGRIMNALADVLPSGRPAAGRRPTNLEAYDLFVRGRGLMSLSLNTVAEGRLLIERAASLDPDFADAHAWIAIGHVWAWALWGEDIKAHVGLARAAAERAVSLDPVGTGVRWILGYVRAYEGAVAEGIAGFEASLKVNPNNFDAWHFLGELKVFNGQVDDALACMERAFRLNPYPPATYYWGLGFTQYAAGRHEDAVRTLLIDVIHRTGAQRILAASLAQLGRIEEAKVEGAEFLASNPHFTIRHWSERQPFQDKATLQRFVDGYLKAGLPL